MNGSITAADLLGFRLCTGQCLLGLEDECICRCRGLWHAALAGAEIPVPPGLTLAAALAGGPAGSTPKRRTWTASRSPQPRAVVTAEDAEHEFMAEISAREVPSIRQVRARMHVGQPRAVALQAHLADVVALMNSTTT